MPIREKLFLRDGIPVPIQCITQRRSWDAQDNTPFHYHDYAELLFGVSGTTTAYVGTETYSLDEGSMIFIPPEMMHRVRTFGPESVHIVVKFLPSVLFSEEQTVTDYAYTRLLLRGADMGKLYFPREEIASLSFDSLFSHICEEWYGEHMGYELSLRAAVISIMLKIMRLWASANPELASLTVTEEQTRLLTQAVEYIRKNYRDATEEECAKALHVSAGHLSRIFKKGMGGISFTAYLTEVKLKAAEKLLVNSDMTMTELAITVGFSTVSYFIAIFRRRHHMTPTAYRKLLHGQYK